MTASECGVVELRQYTLKPAYRDVLADLFDRHLVEGQERKGITVLGQFRDVRRPERFVWLRGFPDMDARHRALEQFYGGPIWVEHRDAANATMLEWHDVLLLRPARPGSGVVADPGERPAPGAATPPGGLVLAGIHLLQHPAGDEVLQLLERDVFPRLRARGVRLLGLYVTEEAKNAFRLPVREGENAVVWIGSVPNEDPGGGTWEGEIDAMLRPWLAAPSTILELAPTGQSLLSHSAGLAR